MPLNRFTADLIPGAALNDEGRTRQAGETQDRRRPHRISPLPSTTR